MIISDASSIVNGALIAYAPKGSQWSGSLLSYSFCAVHRVHQLWWCHQRKEVYSNPDNFVQLMAGHTIYSIAGNNFVIRAAAQAVMISTRIMECLDEQAALCRETELLWQGVAGTEAFLPKKVKWERNQDSNFFSPSTRMYWRHKGAGATVRFFRVVRSTLLIIRRLFILSMRVMDAIAAFSYNAATEHEAVGEFFVNCSKWIDLLINNNKKMLTTLKNNRIVMASVLKSMNAAITVEELIDSVEKAFNITEPVNDNVKGVPQIVRVVAKDVFQRSMFGLCQTFGLAPYMPKNWVPPLRPPWIEALDAPPKERFPPSKWVKLIKV